VVAESIALLPTKVQASPRLDGLPVAIIGAGPVGLAAAAQLLERGVEVMIFESGPRAGHAIAQWGHTRLFTPWEHLVDSASGRLLDRAGWESPQAGRHPTGAELVRDYLLPLASTPELSARIRYGSTVTGVSREGMDRTRSVDRAGTPFIIRVATARTSVDHRARAVIDASGTWSTPNSFASNGLPVTTDAAGLASCVIGALPDVLGADRERFSGRHTVVVGAGHSAANTLLALARLAQRAPGTRVSWVIRGANPVRVYGSADDELEARGRLGTELHELVRRGHVTLIDRFEIDDVAPQDVGSQEESGIELQGRRAGERFTLRSDLVVNATGFRPELSMLGELRLDLDEIVEAPRALAPLIDPNLHSCGTVYPHGVDELAHPEPNFYIAGMKSYGRAPTFLLLTGYEQVRSIADELAGRHREARSVQLVLPATGVCSTAPSAASGCCGSDAPTESAVLV
jgi:thioredoxin reductase